MTDSRPYLLRGIYEWIADNDHDVHILVHTNYPGVVVPEEKDTDGQIVLNISMGATRELVMDNEKISFTAAFKGVLHDLWVPMGSIAGIYSRQTGQGVVFEVAQAVPAAPEPVEGGVVEPEEPKQRPGLRLVK
jgi:stringent starvation protein B